MAGASANNISNLRFVTTPSRRSRSIGASFAAVSAYDERNLSKTLQNARDLLPSL
jgi:hypothetical protein